MRRAAKRDDNHAELVAAARAVGCTVLDLGSVGDGCPDLCLGVSGANLLVEVKDGSKPPSRRRLTEDEKTFHREWRGQVEVVETVADLLKLINKARYR